MMVNEVALASVTVAVWPLILTVLFASVGSNDIPAKTTLVPAGPDNGLKLATAGTERNGVETVAILLNDDENVAPALGVPR